MSAVGIASIVLGSVAVVLRGSTIVAPEPTLRWFVGAIDKKGSIRGMGAFCLTLGPPMAWAGSSEDSILALLVLTVGRIWSVLGAAAVLVPGAIGRGIAALLPTDPDNRLAVWRLGGLKAAFGVLLIYFGARAL